MFLKRLASALSRKKRPKVQILIVGLDNSGKSSLVDQLKSSKIGSELAATTPTVGFQVETFTYQNLTLTCFDMSGQSRYRTLWEHHYANAQAIIFVLDSSDRIRMCVAKNELEELLRHRDIATNPAPMIFFANKMDLDGAMSPADCSQLLELDRIGDRPWRVASCNALTGQGIAEGIDWLADHLAAT